MKIKQFLLIALGIIGIAVAFHFLKQPPVSPAQLKSETIPSIEVQGQTISFPYASTNTADNLLIRTDAEKYPAVLGGVIVYAMVENKSGSNQSGNFQLYFPKLDIQIRTISVMMTGIHQITVDDYVTTTIADATSTRTISYKTGSHFATTTGNYWQKISNLTSFTATDTATFLGVNKTLIRPKPNELPSKKVVVALVKDSIVYYKIEIKTPARNLNDEFYIEALGANNAYGLLDPTILTENFNSYSDGNLNGQGSWSGDVGFQVEGTTVYEGAKAVVGGAGINIHKQGTSLIDGKTTVYIQTHSYASWTSGTFTAFALDVLAGTSWCPFVIHQNGSAYIATWTLIGAFSADVWHKVVFEWRSSPDYKYRVTVDDGTPSAWVATWGGGDWTTGLDTIRLYNNAGYASAIYFDCIGESSCVPPVITVPTMPSIIIE